MANTGKLKVGTKAGMGKTGIRKIQNHLVIGVVFF